MGIAQVIKKIRTENNLTQKQFGEKLGYAPSTVADWEKSATEPNLDVLRKLKKTFDITYDELLDD